MCVLAWLCVSSLYKRDPGYRALIVRCGMGCMPGPALPKRMQQPPTKPPRLLSAQDEEGEEEGDCFPPFTHTPSHLPPSFPKHCPRKTWASFLESSTFFSLQVCFLASAFLSLSISMCYITPTSSHTHPHISLLYLRWLSWCQHHSVSPHVSTMICVCGSVDVGPWHRSAAASLTWFVCKELSAGGHWRALSWLPSTNEPLLTWRPHMCVCVCVCSSVWLCYCLFMWLCTVWFHYIFAIVCLCLCGAVPRADGDQRRSEQISGLAEGPTVTTGWESSSDSCREGQVILRGVPVKSLFSH